MNIPTNQDHLTFSQKCKSYGHLDQPCAICSCLLLFLHKMIHDMHYFKSTITSIHKCKHPSQLPAWVSMYIIPFQNLFLDINPHTHVNIPLLVMFEFPIVHF